jgi:hypothetical protein
MRSRIVDVYQQKATDSSKNIRITYATKRAEF